MGPYSRQDLGMARALEGDPYVEGRGLIPILIIAPLHGARFLSGGSRIRRRVIRDSGFRQNAFGRRPVSMVFVYYGQAARP
jgi:hypothetical protein